MRVHLPSLSLSVSAAPEFAELAARDTTGAHEIVERPDQADLILFTDCHLLPHDPALRAVRRHPLRRAYPDKFFVYNERDLPVGGLPGLYVSMPMGSFQSSHQRAWGYHTVDKPHLDGEPSLLFSFVGSRTHPVREKVAALSHARAVVTNVEGFTFYDPSSRDFEERRREFDAVMGNSKFVLCPRGKGTSSIRMYETMAAGRVPVIISDDWVAPEGPTWDEFSVRWPEAELDALPAHLELREEQARDMGRRARAAFEAWFSPAVTFGHMISAVADLKQLGSHGSLPKPGWRDEVWRTSVLDHVRWCSKNHVGQAVRESRQALRRAQRKA